MKKIIDFFDKLEDKTRKVLSRHPVIYAFIGGTGIILFWRGIWHTADFAVNFLAFSNAANQTIDSGRIWWDGPLSLFIGAGMLLLIGVFISSFIGNEIILSGIKGEKKLTEKTEAEIQEESVDVKKIKREVENLSDRLGKIEEDLSNK